MLRSDLRADACCSIRFTISHRDDVRYGLGIRVNRFKPIPSSGFRNSMDHPDLGNSSV